VAAGRLRLRFAIRTVAARVLGVEPGWKRVRVVAVKSGTFYGRPMTARHIYTVAGGGTGGLGDGGPATQAQLDDPLAVAVDGAGNLAITDLADNRVRVVAARAGTFYGQAMTAHHIYTVAGTGTAGYTGDSGPAAAEVSFPQGVGVDGAGNLVIADSGNQRVRVVAVASGTFYRQPMTAGHIYTVASNGSPSHQSGGQGYSGDAGPALRAQLDFPGAWRWTPRATW